MKTLLFFLLLVASPLFAQMGVTVLGKQHQARDNFAERPYGDDDISYGLFLEAFEGVGAWRFGASASSDLSGLEGADSVITPEITVLVTDRIWETGVSVLIDYLDLDGEADWGDVYYQVQFGINLPLGDRLQVGAHGFFPMESLGDITDIRFNTLDLGLMIRLMF